MTSLSLSELPGVRRYGTELGTVTAAAGLMLDSLVDVGRRARDTGRTSLTAEDSPKKFHVQVKKNYCSTSLTRDQQESK